MPKTHAPSKATVNRFDTDVERLQTGSHHSPHSILGPHEIEGRVVVRAYHPDATSVVVTTVEGQYPAKKIHPGGLFEAEASSAVLAGYRLKMASASQTWETDDPYRFLPTLGELDLHLVSEGKHASLWRGPSQSRTASLGLIGDYLVAAATDLRAQGRAADAVALLDEGFAAKQITTQQTQTALALDLSDAANLALKALAYQEALPQLQRLIAQYPAAPQSGVARQALAATHPIIGTLVHRDGSVSAAELRLATHFRLLPSGYVTTGPFYPGSPDANGDFTFSNVPQGGPYTLEVLSSTGWTTNVDPATNQPIDTVTASPLTVADMGFVVAPS